jgi:hypothetical protein
MSSSEKKSLLAKQVWILFIGVTLASTAIVNGTPMINPNIIP